MRKTIVNTGEQLLQEGVKVVSEKAKKQGMIAKFASKQAGALWGPRAKLLAKLPPGLLSRVSRLIDANEFAAAVAATPEEQIEATLQGPMRGFILGEVVGRMGSEFIPGRGSDLDAVIQLKFMDSPTPEVFQIEIKNGQCRTGPGQPFSDDATSKIETDALSFVKMTSGMETGVDLYLGGKMKFDGGMMLLTRLTRMFNIPDPTGGAGKPKAEAVAA